VSGRNKQPLSVIQGKGRSNHLTKSEIKKRQQQEDAMRGFTDKIDPPTYLTKKQRDDFEKIAVELLRLNIFSNLDVDSLARYIDSKTQYLELIRHIKRIKPTDFIEENGKKKAYANEDYAKLMRVKNSLFNECRSAASDLGLTITSRLKLVIPDNGKKDENKSEFEKKFGDV